MRDVRNALPRLPSQTGTNSKNKLEQVTRGHSQINTVDSTHIGIISDISSKCITAKVREETGDAL